MFGWYIYIYVKWFKFHFRAAQWFVMIHWMAFVCIKLHMHIIWYFVYVAASGFTLKIKTIQIKINGYRKYNFDWLIVYRIHTASLYHTLRKLDKTSSLSLACDRSVISTGTLISSIKKLVTTIQEKHCWQWR